MSRRVDTYYYCVVVRATGSVLYIASDVAGVNLLCLYCRFSAALLLLVVLLWAIWGGTRNHFYLSTHHRNSKTVVSESGFFPFLSFPFLSLLQWM